MTKTSHFFIIIGKKTYGQRIPIVVILEHESTLENFVELIRFVLNKVYKNSKRIFSPYYNGDMRIRFKVTILISNIKIVLITS